MPSIWNSKSFCLLLAAETPENGGDDLLLGADFLKKCLEMFSVPARGYEANSRAFPIKHLNIVDPLKENNNLGRSVSKGKLLFSYFWFDCLPFFSIYKDVIRAS